MREGFRVVGPDGKVMPERFREIRRNKSLVEVEAMESGGHAMVHCTRIISDKKEAAMATKKVSGSPKFDFKAIAGERWSKPMAFDHKGVKAEAHVVVNRITKKYRAFNTYNGSLGKQGKTGSVFAFKDYAQLTARLMDRGYKRIGGSPTASPKPIKKAKPEQVEHHNYRPVTVKPAKGPVTVIPKAKPTQALAPAPVKEAPNANVPAQPVAPPAPPAQS
jgi:hypothetical protein